jgi:RNA exonuclease NGL2
MLDFNFPPDDPAYSLIVGEPLSVVQEARLTASRVVHTSIDPTVSKSVNHPGDEEGENDPDKVITNARPASPADGLLTSSDLLELFSNGVLLRSAYDDGLRVARTLRSDVTTFGDRVSLPSAQRGAHEPEWTCYAHYWKTGLGKSCLFSGDFLLADHISAQDYIFIIEPSTRRSVVTGLLKPHETKDLEPGLPQAGVCGSDHFSLCAEIGWVDNA